MNLDDIRQAQKDLLDESHDYFSVFFEWEKQAQEEFVNSVFGDDDEEEE